MTNEQREAIEKLKERFEPNKFGGICVLGYKKKYCFGKSDLQALDTVLSLIKEQDKYIKDANDITTEMSNDIKKLTSEIKKKYKKIEKALNIAFDYGQTDGDHHKAWVIDQMVRALTGKKYEKWINNYIYDEETGDSYSWDKGIAP